MIIFEGIIELEFFIFIKDAWNAVFCRGFKTLVVQHNDDNVMGQAWVRVAVAVAVARWIRVSNASDFINFRFFIRRSIYYGEG